MLILEENEITEEYKRQICTEFLQLKSEEIIQAVKAQSRVKHYKCGEYIYRSGELIKEIPILVKGVVGYFSFCRAGTEVMSCICCETSFVLDGSFSLENPVSRENLKVIESSDILMIPLSIIIDLVHTNSEMMERLITFYRRSLIYLIDFSRKRTLPMENRVLAMKNFQPGLWSRLPEKTKAQMLNVSTEHWARYKKKEKQIEKQIADKNSGK